MSIRSQVAALLRRAADELEPAAPTPTPPPVAPTRVAPVDADPEGDAANRFAAVVYLRRALRRYSPEEKPAEA